MSEQVGQDAKPLGIFAVPTMGVVRSRAKHELPPEALFDALNVRVDDARLRPRHAIVQSAAPLFGSRVTGAFFFYNEGNAPILLAGTRSDLWKYQSGAWTNVTGPALSAAEFQQSSFAAMQVGATVYVIHVNGANAPQLWNGATMADVAGSPLVWDDIAAINNRFVGIKYPYTVSWGDTTSIDKFPALNFRTLADTPDRLVAISPQGPMGATLYKERSVWIASPQQGTGASAFRFELRGTFEGPAGKKAVVKGVNGADMYMTNDGRVAVWDGSSHRWIADEVWRLIRDDIDPSKANLIHGLYDAATDAVIFYYPRVGDAGACTGQLLINLPGPVSGAKVVAPFPGRSVIGLTASEPGRAVNGTRMLNVFTSAVTPIHAVLGSDSTEGDLGTPFTGYWETGFVASPGLRQQRIDGVECFMERGDDYGGLDLIAVSSDTLADDGKQAEPRLVDLTRKRPYDAQPVNARGRFFALRFEFDSDARVGYRGATPYARPV